MKDIDPLHDIMFRYLFLEDRPQNLLLLLNGLLECKGGERLTEILSAYRRREYLNNRHYCEMMTILAADKENRTSLILIALQPHPESEDYVLPLMLAETEKVRRG